MTEDRPTSGRASLAATVVRVASLWVLAGALFKLFKGSPNDLPPSVRGFLGDQITTFRVAIAVELCVVILCLLRPRLGWVPLIVLYVVFGAVLVPLVLSGATSCGCFGSSVTIPPAVMLAIDSIVLLAVLAVRPWSVLESKPLRPLVLAPLFAAAVAAPMLEFKPVDLTPAASDDGAADSANPAKPSVQTPVAAPVTGDFYEFKVRSWTGSVLQDTDLARFIDTDIPAPCHVVIYRQTCDHCGEHLEKLVLNPISDRPVALVRIVENGDTPENDVTQLKPVDAIQLEIPALPRGYGIPTPMSFDVDDVYVISNLWYEGKDKGK